MSFHDVNLKNNGTIVFSRFSTVYGWVSKSFSDMGETFKRGTNETPLPTHLFFNAFCDRPLGIYECR